MNENVFGKLTKNAKTILLQAEKLSEERGEALNSTHILQSITRLKGTLAKDILQEYTITSEEIEIITSVETKHRGRFGQQVSDDAKKVIIDSFKLAAQFKHYNVDAEHILLSIVSSESCFAYNLINRIGVDPQIIKKQLQSIFKDLFEMDKLIKDQAVERFNDSSGQNVFEGDEDPLLGTQSQPLGGLRTISPNEKFFEDASIDLIKKAKKGEIDLVYGREEEISRCIRILMRRTKNNPIFIGESGVGKTAIVEGLAHKIASGKVPSALLNKKIISLDMGVLIAGTIYRGQFEERLKKVLSHVKNNKDIIIFIDEVHSIVGTGSAEGSMDAANILKPALAKGEIRLIGATTTEEYRKFIEKDPALERRLQPIMVKEPEESETINILKEIRPLYEKHHAVKISDEAIVASVELSQKYLKDRFLPDKAIDLIDEAAAEKKINFSLDQESLKLEKLKSQISQLENQKEELIIQEKFEMAAKIKEKELQLKKKQDELSSKSLKKEPKIIVEREDIAKIVSQITGVPLGNLKSVEARRYKRIEEVIKKNIAGQEEAIRELSRVIRRNRSGIREQNKPIGSFIFLGPSGVGKTEVAKVLSEKFYLDKKALIRFDMSEFSERHNVAQLTGAPPGYVGYEDAGKLTERVRRNPYSILLFDEIEKAHAEVFNVLLQILDEGTLTDARGKTTDFKNTIIIMTSNIGLDEYASIKKIGFKTDEEQKYKQIKELLSKRVGEFLRPELINRIDKIIVFDTLGKNDLEKIALLNIEKLQKRLLDMEIEASFSKELIKEILEINFDPMFGARPLVREISEKIESQISDLIISGDVSKGDKVEFTINKDGKLQHRKA
ncbi:MAG: ATP-dependent Clp protease ATP-binding subunit ClpC [candidate division WS2 bacterium ADurb.Bin280]|uniref:ATP-dependent Clp protease ATP-binding subunit ClpC n=1 Tax=candidate division WS2 bacterium ADurb.Bin280 TaxID=1852829 RepID=A0A1V5SFY3_9BACT|nr:MAG: ATP-dependent Clp protease ATP-binding subunit ClpC [candidate division WS2 bacterium ADurb.Bin280]